MNSQDEKLPTLHERTKPLDYAGPRTSIRFRAHYVSCAMMISALVLCLISIGLLLTAPNSTPHEAKTFILLLWVVAAVLALIGVTAGMISVSRHQHGWAYLIANIAILLLIAIAIGVFAQAFANYHPMKF